MREQTIAFVEEFGNEQLQLEEAGNSSHFLVSAVLADGSEIEKLEKDLRKLRKKLLGGKQKIRKN